MPTTDPETFAPFATASFDASPRGTAEGAPASRAEHEQLAADLIQMGEWLDAARRELSSLKAELAKRDAGLAQDNKDSEEMNAAFVERGNEIDRLKAELAKRDEAVERHVAWLAMRDSQITDLKAQLADANENIVAKHNAANRVIGQQYNVIATLRAQLARAEEVEKAAGELVADSRHHHRHNNEHAVVVRRKFVSRLEQVMAATTSEPIFGDCDHERGLYGKYRVQRLDGSSGPGGKHEHCEYFVLDLSHDPHAIPAIHAYAKSCEKEYPVLAADLVRTYDLHFAPPAAEGPEQETGAGCRCETVRIPSGAAVVNAAWYARLMLVVRRLGKRRRPNEMACYVTGIGEDIRDLSIVLADERDVVLRLSAPAAEGEVKP